LDLESTAIAPLTTGKSPFALLAALGEIGAVEAAPSRCRVRKLYVSVTKLRAVTSARIS